MNYVHAALRKGIADQLTDDQRMGILYYDSTSGGKPPSRPVFGAANSGFHTALPQGSQVATLYERDNHPIGTLPLVDDASKLVRLLPGESVLLHPDGRVLCHIANSGTTTLYSDPTGLGIVLDSVTKTVDLTAGALGTLSLTGAHLICDAPIEAQSTLAFSQGTNSKSVSLGIAAGSGGSVGATIRGGSNMGQITVISGTSGTSAGIFCILHSDAITPDSFIMLTPVGFPAASILLAVDPTVGTGFVNILCEQIPTLNTQFSLNYLISE